ncbi:MAG: hypothetical protein NC038_02105 [Paludibacter sp.]|nr:hypothetical protein [Bacteroidales bacterium]MCM1353423.1 hypothetical protein [Bacteroides sp.]MCM1481429.1 hypothetical protein [Paludibacter sp.]
MKRTGVYFLGLMMLGCCRPANIREAIATVDSISANYETDTSLDSARLYNIVALLDEPHLAAWHAKALYWLGRDAEKHCRYDEAVQFYGRVDSLTSDFSLLGHSSLHKAGVYKWQCKDSLALVSYRQAADHLLAARDSVYFPLALVETALLAEQLQHTTESDVYLSVIRHLQDEITWQTTSRAYSGVWIGLASALVLLAIGVLWMVGYYRRGRTIPVSITEEDVEKNIRTLLSQADIEECICWKDYERMKDFVNAWLYKAVDKIGEECPDLSESEVRFCVLVMLGFSAKEIAGMMHLSPQSISNKKTRTAAKFGTTAAELRHKLIQITIN